MAIKPEGKHRSPGPSAAHSQDFLYNTKVLSAEDVAYWYLRLNGFLALRNFLVHGDRPGQSRTDIDVLGVRFPHRNEHLRDPMEDDEWIRATNRTMVVFCEAKGNAADINPSWRNQNRKMMESFLALVGIAPTDQRENLAKRLYETGKAEEQDYVIQTLLIHHDPESRVQPGWPETKVIQLCDALGFIHARFARYRQIKADHNQWDPAGQDLWEAFERYRKHCDKFIESVLSQISLGGP